MVKSPPGIAGDGQVRLSLDPWIGKPLEEGVATDSVLLLGESHGQRSLAGYGP